MFNPYFRKDNITLYHGDCREVMAAMTDASIDLVLTDTPYGITAQDWDRPPDLAWMWGEFRRLLADRGTVVMTATQPFASMLVASNPRWFRHEWIWRKSRAANFGGARYQPLKKHESVLVFAPGPHRYNPVKVAGDAYKSRTQHPRTNTKYGSFGSADYQPNETRTERYPDSVIDVPSMRQQDLLHPTQKPERLMEYLARTYTDPGCVVLDPYCGSGSTLTACRNLGLPCVGIELEERYCRVTVERLTDNKRS